MSVSKILSKLMAEVILNTHMNGSLQYSEKRQTRVSRTTSALCRSVAVHSMKTLVVFSVILLCSPKRKLNCHYAFKFAKSINTVDNWRQR